MLRSWEELENECRGCKKCVLWETRTNIVFGVGNREADVMLIGEGPGANEDMEGVPFVGRAGKLLNDMLAIIDLDRTKVYIANTVKCRPPGNRDPLFAEQEACGGYLRNQIELINPKIIVCLGRIAAMSIIDTDFKITRDHGKWYDKDDGRRYMALYHPAALLRDPRRRPETFEDLKEMGRAMREISERKEEVTHTYD